MGESRVRALAARAEGSGAFAAWEGQARLPTARRSGYEQRAAASGQEANMSKGQQTPKKVNKPKLSVKEKAAKKKEKKAGK